MNKKNLYTLCACFLITGVIQAKKTIETRSKLQESIGYQAGALIEHAHKTIHCCAGQLCTPSCNAKNIAEILEELADVQDIMFDLLKELVDSSESYTLANATRKELELLRNTLQDINHDTKPETSDKTWWKNTHEKIKQVLSKTIKQTGK